MFRLKANTAQSSERQGASRRYSRSTNRRLAPCRSRKPETGISFERNSGWSTQVGSKIQSRYLYNVGARQENFWDLLASVLSRKKATNLLDVADLLSQSPQHTTLGLSDAVGAETKLLGDRVGVSTFDGRLPKRSPGLFSEIVFDLVQRSMQ